MNKMKKLASLLLALVMVFAMSATAFAESTEGTTATGTITITPPTDVDAGATNTYMIYKVFDAVGNGTSISYKLVPGKTTAPEGFTVDTAGNVTYSGTGTAELTAADIAAIAAYVTEADLVATVTAEGKADAVATGLPNGYYYITTSTGTVVTIDSTNPNASVFDKNTVPTLEKKITDASSFDEDGKTALAQVGTTVTYEATITIGKGAKGYEFHDQMGAGLQYNNDVQVYYNSVADGNLVLEDNYDDTTAEGDTITIKFNDDYIKTLEVGAKLIVKYSATITSDALQTDPAENKAWLEYGDKNSNNKTPESKTETYNAKFTVTKKDGYNKPLAGAGFVIKNAEGKYYKIDDNNVVTWVDSIDDATEHFSDENGNVQAFTGLANGTYTLVEKTVPAGYNKAADFDFTVAEHDYTPANLEKATTVVNNAGTELPSTGGMGTTMLYVVGGLLVAGAVVVMISRKKAEEK